jgi:hypothetical protein
MTVILGAPLEPPDVRKIAQGVGVVRGMFARIEAEHGPNFGLDVLLSGYVTIAVERIGIEKTIEALDNTRRRLREVALQNLRST